MERLEPLEPLQPIVERINSRITKNNPEKIVRISDRSGIYLHQNFLRNWNTARVSNAETLLMNVKMEDILRLGQQAICVGAEEKNISSKSAMLLTPLLKNDDRRLLASRIGLCYNWKYVLDLAKNGNYDSEVEFVCSRDLFLINTIAFWCRLNKMSAEKTGTTLLSEYVPMMKDIFNKIMASNEVLKFPDLSKKLFEQKFEDKREFPKFVETSLGEIKQATKTEKSMHMAGGYNPRAFI